MPADQHSITEAAKIRRGLPANLISSGARVDILIVGEKTEVARGALNIKIRGTVEVRGEAPNSLTMEKIVAAVQSASGQRKVVNKMTLKKR